MTITIKLQPLFLRSLDLQIRDNGGDGWNCGVKLIRDVTKTCASAVYQIQNGAQVETLNTINVGSINCGPDECSIEYCLDGRLYKLHTVDSRREPKALKSTVILGFRAQEARAKLVSTYGEGGVNFHSCFDDPLASLAEYVERGAA